MNHHHLTPPHSTQLFCVSPPEGTSVYSAGVLLHGCGDNGRERKGWSLEKDYELSFSKEECCREAVTPSALCIPSEDS